MEKIKVGIVGYGNLGRGVETAVLDSPDLALAGIFTRRPGEVRANGPVYPVETLDEGADAEVLVLCGSSADDLRWQSPRYAGAYHIVDSFDLHGDIPAHFAAVDAAARRGRRLAVVSAGWDPGLFSLARVIADAVLPGAGIHTLWGPGVSQGHSAALRRLPGVLDARQVTVPAADAAERLLAGEVLTPQQAHRRVCYVVPEADTDRAELRRRICAMPRYFAGWETEVRFVTAAELPGGLPHGGRVMALGEDGARGSLELALPSNPAFTGRVLAACARAAARLGRAGEVGARTVPDVPAALLSPLSPEEQRAKWL